MIRYNINEMFWEQNQSTGQRIISIQYNSKIIFHVSSTNFSDKYWTSRVVPAGYSFSLTETIICGKVFEVLPGIMELLQKKDLTLEELQKYLFDLPKISDIQEE